VALGKEEQARLGAELPVAERHRGGEPGGYLRAAGGRGGGGRGNNESIAGKLGQAKNGFMGGMVVGEQTTRAYSEIKAQLPKAIADLNLTIARAKDLSSSLAKFNLTLTVPSPVQAPAAATVRRTSSQ
jgi:hypothetical protein